jgi:hypothetical protein
MRYRILKSYIPEGTKDKVIFVAIESEIYVLYFKYYEGGYKFQVVWNFKEI